MSTASPTTAAPTANPTATYDNHPWYSISYNVSGADTANSPVGYGAIMVILVGALMIWHYMFVGVAAKLAWTGERSTWGKYALIDVILLNIIPVCLFFGIVLFGLGTGLYVLQQRAWVQYYPNAVSNFGIFVHKMSCISHFGVWRVSN